MTVRIAAGRVALAAGEPAANRAAAAAAVERAAVAGARVVVLPELVNSGYVLRDRAEARALAEPLDGPTVTDWIALAARHDLVLVGGVCEAAADGVPHNSAVLVDPGGLRAVYRKVHLWDREAELFAAGDAAPAVVDTAAGRIAMLVCYDLEFPEWIRRPALAGAELLAVPTNWPQAVPPARPPGERPMEVVRAMAGASVNRVAIAVADRCRPERGVDWVGATAVIAPDGYPVAGGWAGGEPDVLVAEVDLADARSKAIGPRNDVFADRRPELYPPGG